MPNMKRAFCALVSLLVVTLTAQATTLTDNHSARKPEVSMVASANPPDQTNDYYVTDYASISR